MAPIRPRSGTGFFTRMQGTFFCCVRCCKGGNFGYDRYYETHYHKIETGSHWTAPRRYAGESDELTASGSVLSGYGSVIEGAQRTDISGNDRRSSSAAQGADFAENASRRMSTASRVKARLRHRQIRVRNKSSGNVSVASHLTAIPGQSHEHRLLPTEKNFHEMARTGNLEEVEKMIKDRINVNCMDEKDRSALHLAAGQGHVEVIRTLLDNDAKADAPDKFGMNALLWAAWFGQQPALDALCNGGALVKCENKQGLTIVHCAASRGHVDVLKYIVDNLLEEDSMDSDDEESGLLPGLGAMQGKMTGLFGAAASYVGLKDKKDQGQATKKTKFRPESSFLEHRCSGQGSKTPIHLAAENGRVEATKFLIQVKCNKLARTADGSTALHLAAKRGHIEMVHLLLENNLDIDIRNEEGMTPLLFAADEGHANVVELLLRQKADCNVKANEKRKEMAAVHFAAQNNHSSVIKVLCNFGVDLDAKCQGGNTAIHLASIADRIEVLQTLISKGANVNAFNDKKRQALHEATENNLTDVVETLLIAGAWVNQVDKTMPLPMATPDDLDESRLLRCKKCPKVFLQRRSLYRHLQDCHGPPRYLDCQRCEFQSKRRDNLRRHYRRVHPQHMDDLHPSSSPQGQPPHSHRWMERRDIAKVSYSPRARPAATASCPPETVNAPGTVPPTPREAVHVAPPQPTPCSVWNEMEIPVAEEVVISPAASLSLLPATAEELPTHNKTPSPVVAPVSGKPLAWLKSQLQQQNLPIASASSSESSEDSDEEEEVTKKKSSLLNIAIDNGLTKVTEVVTKMNFRNGDKVSEVTRTRVYEAGSK